AREVVAVEELDLGRALLDVEVVELGGEAEQPVPQLDPLHGGPRARLGEDGERAGAAPLDLRRARRLLDASLEVVAARAVEEPGAAEVGRPGGGGGREQDEDGQAPGPGGRSAESSGTVGGPGWHDGQSYRRRRPAAPGDGGPGKPLVFAAATRYERRSRRTNEQEHRLHGHGGPEVEGRGADDRG